MGSRRTIPVFDKSNRTDGPLSRSDFVFNVEQDRYTYPRGKHLVQFQRTYTTPRSWRHVSGRESHS